MADRLTTLATVALILAGCSAALTAPRQVVDAASVWDRMLAAKGGREKLHAVHTLVVSTRDPLAGFSRRDVAGGLKYEIVAAFPDRFWWWSDYRPGKLGFDVQVWNRTARWWWATSNGRAAGQPEWGPRLESDRRLEVLQLAYLLETQFVQPRLLRAFEISGKAGRRVVVEAATPSTSRVRYTVDPTTYLPESVEIGTEGTAYQFSSWVNVDGIRMPQQDGKIALHFLINPNVDPKLFETPPDNVTSADAWKTFLRK